MKDQANFSATRRKLLKVSGGGLMLIPVINLVGCADEGTDTAPPAPTQAPEPPAPSQPATTTAPAPQPAPQAPPAAELTRLEESESSAQALGYRHAASDVDTQAYPRYEAGQLCSNCNLYVTENSPEPGWGACSIFPGKLVNADGWCNVYQPVA